jgi:hypothetical protein
LFDTAALPGFSKNQIAASGPPGHTHFRNELSRLIQGDVGSLFGAIYIPNVKNLRKEMGAASLQTWPIPKVLGPSALPGVIVGGSESLPSGHQTTNL